MRRVEIKVITRARKEAVEKIGEDSYRVKVFVPPEKGKANKRVIGLAAKEFGVRKNSVRIVSGESSNKKIIEIG
ncbi:MAG: DUF167 domain-containing protein [Candidatus Omnitrophica bacterium]|nr:DUF167 domain-containing protein [Candidatus Omnitrophota bacterium]MBU1933384.1 DUF167 domain-containing protein [Candidatus Omnitrophota bacterium]